MASPSVSPSGSQRTKSTKPTTVSTRRSTAYDANFRQHCKDHHIFPPFYKFPDGRRPPKPGNLNEIRQALKVPRRSLPPSVASEADFEDFQYKTTTKSEGTVMRNIIPLIAGDADIPNEGHLHAKRRCLKLLEDAALLRVKRKREKFRGNECSRSHCSYCSTSSQPPRRCNKRPATGLPRDRNIENSTIPSV